MEIVSTLNSFLIYGIHVSIRQRVLTNHKGCVLYQDLISRSFVLNLVISATSEHQALFFFFYSKLLDYSIRKAGKNVIV